MLCYDIAVTVGINANGLAPFGCFPPRDRCEKEVTTNWIAVNLDVDDGVTCQMVSYELRKWTGCRVGTL